MTSQRLGLREFFVLAVLALIFFAPGISSIPPIDRDEGRYVQATTQMLETKDFIDVRFMDKPRYLQPAGIYWIQSASVAAFGDYKAHKIWAHRIPSVINGIIAVLLCAWIAGAFFGRRAGMAAGIMLAACFSLNFEARIAKIDATLCMITLACQAALTRMRLDQIEGKPRGWQVAATFWALLGVGVMIKGPVPLIVSGGTLALLSIWERSTEMLKRLRAFPFALITLAIALPWLIAIGVKSHGAFFEASVGKNLLGKVGKGEQSHGSPPGYHLLLVNAMFWPSVLFFVTAIPAIWNHRRDPRVKFLLCWIAPTWLMFELVATKLPHYVLPTYGALAALAAGAWFGDLTVTHSKVAVWLGRAYAVFWAVIGLTLAAASPVLLHELQGETNAISIIIAAISGALTLATLAALVLKKKAHALLACAVAAMVAWTNLFVWSGPRLTNIWLSPRIAAAMKAYAPCPKPVLATTPFQEASMAYLGGTQTLFVGPVQAADHLAAHPSCAMALIGTDEYPAFAARIATYGIQIQEVAVIDGKNYSNNDKMHLRLFRNPPIADVVIPAAK